jgi:hypothetical protein
VKHRAGSFEHGFADKIFEAISSRPFAWRATSLSMAPAITDRLRQVMRVSVHLLLSTLDRKSLSRHDLLLFFDALSMTAAFKVLRAKPGAHDLRNLSGGVVRAPIASTFASLCWRASRAVSSDQATAARTPGTLLAVIAMPVPEPQTSTP